MSEIQKPAVTTAVVNFLALVTEGEETNVVQVLDTNIVVPDRTFGFKGPYSLNGPEWHQWEAWANALAASDPQKLAKVFRGYRWGFDYGLYAFKVEFTWSPDGDHQGKVLDRVHIGSYDWVMLLNRDYTRTRDCGC